MVETQRDDRTFWVVLGGVGYELPAESNDLWWWSCPKKSFDSGRIGGLRVAD